ncbi:NAD(P)/FAD-dependent oxidoreductase [Streptomyces chartreusis]
MATTPQNLLIVGASLAGLRAAETARREGFTGAVTLIGDEPHPPYNRPPLSKEHLKSDYTTATCFRPEHELRDELGLDLRLSTRATALDTRNRQVHTPGGGVLSYDKLVIATGAAPRTLAPLAGKAGVHTLRTVEEATSLREAITPHSSVVVIGAGFIGSEIASAARDKHADVTIVEAAPVPLVRAVGPDTGRALAALHGRNGTRLLCGTHATEVHGEDRVTALTLSNGETVPADVVVVGIGAAPATRWLRDSGLSLHPGDGGIICDAYLRTSDPDVYAAGDVAHWPNTLMDGDMRLENYTAASDQGQRAAFNALFPDRAAPFTTVPYFWSDWYGNRIQFVGTAQADETVFTAGDADSDSFVALYLSGARLVGAAALNNPRVIMKLRRIIADRGSIDSARELLDARRIPTGRR